MIANIISRYTFTLTDTLNTSGHEFKLDSDYDGKSQIKFHRKPKAEEDDFILVMDGKDIAFQGIISKIENESNSDAYKVTAVEMQTLFNQKVILSDESIKTETGIEDFIADQIRKNFVESDDELVNIDYLTVTANTHTPIATAVQADDGIYNLKTYIANAMTMYGVFVEFEFTNEALNVVIEKKEQPEFKIDATLPEVQNLTEVIDYKVVTKLTVLWKSATYQFFMKTDGTITTDKNDPDRAKGGSDVIVSNAETEAAMTQEAHDKFTSNSYNHKITFDVSPNSKMIPSKQVIETEEGGGSKLPDGYRQLTYIESTGTQYINTGYIAQSDNLKIAIRFAYTSVATGQSIFGAQNSTGTLYGVIPYTSEAGRPYLYMGTSSKIMSTSVSANVVNAWEISAVNGGASWNANGTTSKASYSGTPNQAFPYFIFANNSGGSVLQPCSAKLYSMQIYDNDVLVHDFIPCRKPSGDVGLYDLVTKQFFGNAGAGVFKQGEAVVSLPKGYERAHYIESTGVQHIDTGFKPNQDTRVVMDAQMTESTSSRFYFGARKSDGSVAFNFLIAAGTHRSDYGESKVTVNGTGLTDRLLIDKNKNVCTANGVTVTNTASTFRSEFSVYLFASNDSGTAGYNGSLKLYTCQMYDDGTLIRDYIPCKDSTGVFGLYDLVEGKFYGNAGTGAFLGTVKRKLPEGYTQVDYIESTGTQYIDTGVVFGASATIDLKLVCDCKWTNQSGDNGVGSVTGGNIFWFGCYQKYIYYGNGINDVRLPNEYDGKRHTWTLDAYEGVFSVDGLVDLNGLTFKMPTQAGGILLPARGDGISIYAFQVYSAGTLVRDFIPCTNAQGTAGLYDLANNAFYTNAGTGSFATGEEIAFVEGVGSEGVVVTKTVNALYVGRFCTIKTKNGIKTSIITAMELNSESSMISLIFGKLKVTLIEKLKGVEARK